MKQDLAIWTQTLAFFNLRDLIILYLDIGQIFIATNINIL